MRPPGWEHVPCRPGRWPTVLEKRGQNASGGGRAAPRAGFPAVEGARTISPPGRQPVGSDPAPTPVPSEKVRPPVLVASRSQQRVPDRTGGAPRWPWPGWTRSRSVPGDNGLRRDESDAGAGGASSAAPDAYETRSSWTAPGPVQSWPRKFPGVSGAPSAWSFAGGKGAADVADRIRSIYEDQPGGSPHPCRWKGSARSRVRFEATDLGRHVAGTSPATIRAQVAAESADFAIGAGATPDHSGADSPLVTEGVPVAGRSAAAWHDRREHRIQRVPSALAASRPTRVLLPSQVPEVHVKRTGFPGGPIPREDGASRLRWPESTNALSEKPGTSHARRFAAPCARRLPATRRVTPSSLPMGPPCVRWFLG
jgi:hypothetical protein